MQVMLRRGLLATALVLLVVAPALAQGSDDPLVNNPNCEAGMLAQRQTAFAEFLVIDFANDPVRARENMFKLGQFYQQLAIDCGYWPTEAELDTLIQTVLRVANVGQILAANTVGTDVEAILAQLEQVQGDSFNGQLLYNGIEPVLGNTTLGCAGCHLGEVAPLTEGTYTRVLDERLLQPEFADYTARQYLVESIVQPNAYVVPNYIEGLMPDGYGSQLDLQQLADLLAYMESQDQPLDE